MANVTYSKARKLAGAALAKLKGADAAATELKVDKRTIRRWLAAAPEDGWTLARDLAQARLQEQLASGKVAPSQLATIAGIAERNLRYGELLRQREARKQGEAEAAQPEREPIREAVNAMPDDRKRLVRDELLLSVERQANEDAERRAAGQEPEPDPTEPDTEYEQRFLAWLDEVAAMSDEAVAGRQAIVTSELDAATAKRWDRSKPAAPEPESAPEPVQESAEPLETAPEPQRPLPRRPDVELIDYGSHLDDHPSWRRWE